MQIPSDIIKFDSRQKFYTGRRGPWLEHLMEDEGMGADEAYRVLLNYELIPFVDPVKGHMATMLKRNKEVHFAIYRKFRGRGQVTSSRIKEFLQPILDKEGFLVTKLGPRDSVRFITHLGFQPLGRTMDGIKTFILNEIRYPRLRNGNNIQTD